MFDYEALYLFWFITFVALKLKTIFTIITLICLLGSAFTVFASHINDNVVKVVYIADLNLSHTPLQTQNSKSNLEKQFGILLYESQAVFQELIKNINQKLSPDIVIFGGNNIAFNETDNNYWQLFLDMISEIKSDIFVNLGVNELKTLNSDELVSSLASFESDRKVTWHSKKIKDFLFVGLDSVSLMNNAKRASKQINWLIDILAKNKKTLTIITLYDPLLKDDGTIVNNKSAKKIANIIAKNHQIKLVIFGGRYFNRCKIINDCLYLAIPSPVVYPCSFKSIEIAKGKIKVRTLTIPLKGVVKKALKSAEDAEYFKSKGNLGAIKSYLSGKLSDREYDYVFHVDF